MNRSPDLRITARRSAFPHSSFSLRAQWPVHPAPITVPLLAYSGGTVWDSHPLPEFMGKRRIVDSIPNLASVHTSATPWDSLIGLDREN